MRFYNFQIPKNIESIQQIYFIQMKLVNNLLILSILLLLVQNAVVASTTTTDTTVRGIDVETVSSFVRVAQTDADSIETINKMMIESAYSDAAKLSKVDTYNLATTFFNSQRYFGDVCNRCKKLQYLAFRQGTLYLTAGLSSLKFSAAGSSGPLNQQLFVAEQQIDGSWAFRSLTQGKYIRADSNLSTVNWQTYVGPWERWYMERHGNHVHVQSAQFSHCYWINSGSTLQQLNGGASSLIVEHWPAINWLWNW